VTFKRQSAVITAVFALIVPLIVSVPAQAATVTATGTNPTVCNQTVDNASNVVAYRLSGGDCVIEFKNTGTANWTVPAGITSVQALVVGGGGAGGRATNSGGAGGGGAGGVTTHSNFSVSGTVTVIVGAGAASQTLFKRGGNGNQSSFSTLIAPGGGGGGLWCDGGCVDTTSGNKSGSGKTVYGMAGGSGGGSGAGNEVSTGGSVTIPTLPAGAVYYGNAAGGAVTGANYHGTGGGGAGGASAARTTASAGATAGGLALSSSITGTAIFYAGGGGGSGGRVDAGAAGGSSIGGSGSIGEGYNTPIATSGLSNTGSGGGGANGTTNNKVSGGGGSGIVIIRYAVAVDSTPPTFATSSFSAAENIATSATAATIRVSESATVTISSGVDAARFNISRSDTDTAIIKFNSSPDYEAPIDIGGDNVYDLTLTATDAATNAGIQAITITVTNVVDTSAFTLFQLAGAATATTYRTTVVITATVTVASKITFNSNGKVLPGCKNKLATGSGSSFSATCAWKASNRGASTLTAASTPTGAGITGATASPISIRVGNRTGPR